MLLLIIKGLHSQFFSLFFSEGPIWFTHNQYFWKMGHSRTQKPTDYWYGYHNFRCASLPPNQSMFPLRDPPFTTCICGTWTMAKQYGIKKLHAIGNLLRNTLKTWGTFWEQLGNKKTKKKNPFPKTKKKKTKHVWAFSLVAWNFYFQNDLSPFATLPNTFIINNAYLLIN